MVASNYPPDHSVVDFIIEEPKKEEIMSEQWQYKQIVKAIETLTIVISIIGLAIVSIVGLAIVINIIQN